MKRIHFIVGFVFLSASILTGCTSAVRSEYYPTGKLKARTAYNSIGTQKKIKSIEYGDLKIEGLNSDESKGLESFTKGAVKGATGR